MTLGDYIKGAAQRRFEWGKFDCATFCAGWIEAQTGAALIADFPPYASEAEAENLICEAGGLIELWETRLQGVARRCLPRAGSVGVVELGEYLTIGGICSSERWVFLTSQGIRAVRVPPERVIAAWCVHG